MLKEFTPDQLFSMIVSDLLTENTRKDERDVPNDTIKKQKVYTIFEVAQMLEPGKTAKSTDGQLVIGKSGHGDLYNKKTGATLKFSAEILNMTFTIEPERVLVPMHVALEAFKSGASIEVDYDNTAYHFDPVAKGNPLLPVDAFIEGVFYVIK